jgi:hypothetical protein
MFVAVDLDGTLCDGSHKVHLLTLPKCPTSGWVDQDWTAWREACIDDKAIVPVLETVKALVAAKHKVEFWTGRGKACEQITRQWLHRFGLDKLPIRMRDDNMGEVPDHVWKRNYLEWYGRPDLILEDRVAVVNMWREEGIMCFQVAPGDY